MLSSGRLLSSTPDQTGIVGIPGRLLNPPAKQQLSLVPAARPSTRIPAIPDEFILLLRPRLFVDLIADSPKLILVSIYSTIPRAYKLIKI